ncbi:MAG: hypothetical protein IH957_05070 [Chloroflexi bacterium]|nr:hypothetical protein [Chloroflexota bacterium]
MTDVGARCQTCAPARKLPQLEINPLLLARAAAAAGVSGVVLGLLWGYLLPGSFGFFSIFIGMGIGWAVAEPVTLATNRKSGTPLQIVAALGVVLAYVVRNIVDSNTIIQTGDISGYIAVVVGIVVAINRLRF